MADNFTSSGTTTTTSEQLPQHETAIVISINNDKEQQQENENEEEEEKSLVNFLHQYRDPQTRKFKNFTASQFMEVWQHYDLDGNGYIEGDELDGFLKEFIASVVPNMTSEELLSSSGLEELKDQFMAAYDENEDNRIEIGELAQMLPTDENFLLLFHRDTPLESSVEFMKIWKQFDKDNSGFIENNELREFLRYLLKTAGKEVCEEKLGEYAQTILQLFDQNGDGKLQLSEMARLLPVKENYLTRPLLKNSNSLSSYEIDRLFRKYDVDKSGQIDEEELNGLLKDLLELTGEDYDEEKMKFYREVIMEQWDVNKDGKIGRKELKMVLLQHSRLCQPPPSSSSSFSH